MFCFKEYNDRYSEISGKEHHKSVCLLLPANLYMHASEIFVSYNISVYIHLSYDNPSVGDVCVKLSQSYVLF